MIIKLGFKLTKLRTDCKVLKQNYNEHLLKLNVVLNRTLNLREYVLNLSGVASQR